jgi:hypothetical protein
MGKRVYGDVIVEKRDPRGRKYYLIGGDYLTSEEVPGSDLEAIEDNCISITPIHLDLTNYAALRALRKWTCEGRHPSTQEVESQIRRRGVCDRAGPRRHGGDPEHLFVPPRSATRAYDRRPPTLREGQTIIPALHGGDDGGAAARRHGEGPRIGTGSGYQTASLAKARPPYRTVRGSLRCVRRGTAGSASWAART